MTELTAKTYWKKNITYVIVLLTIWFLVAYCGGIFWKSTLDQFSIGGIKLGFWIAQQGAIYIFVVLIFVYVWLMNRLDKEHGVYER
jgi:putative solute:sodium symporter small subunit